MSAMTLFTSCGRIGDVWCSCDLALNPQVGAWIAALMLVRSTYGHGP